MDRSNHADDTDIAYIDNELVRDALLLMGGMYYVTIHSEAAHSTLTPSQRMVLLTSQVPFPLGGVDGSYPRRNMKSIACDKLAVCKHWRWFTQCKVCDSTASERLIFLRLERKKGNISSLVSEHGVTISSCKMSAGTSMRDHLQQCSTGKCKECGEACIFEDKKQRSACKRCDSCFCEHGRVRATCKKCGGASICEHG